MRKRILSILLAVVMMVTLLPVSAAAASSSDNVNAVRTAVDKLVTDYAKKVYRADSAKNSFIDFATHGMTANGKKMIAKEGDPIVSTLFNAELTKAALTEAIFSAIVMAQDSDSDVIYVQGNPCWHSYGCKFDYTAYSDKDFTKLLCALTDTNMVYGSDLYPGPTNTHDDMLELIVGSLNTNFKITPTQINWQTIEYCIELTVSDVFDFEGNNYDDLSDKGFDTSTDRDLNRIGKLLTVMGLDEFDWEFKKSFYITVPNLCSHNPNQYYWKQIDGELVSVSDDGWNVNSLIRTVASYEGTEKERFFYRTDRVISLQNDYPWVVEFRMNGKTPFILAPKDWYSYDGSLLLVKDSQRIAGAQAYNYTESNEATGEDVIHKGRYQYGINLVNRGYDDNTNHTYRLENRISDDGSNMVWLLVDGVEYGPMTEYSIYYDKLVSSEEQATTDDWFNGKDFSFRYIFNRSISAGLNTLPEYLKIWECIGEDSFWIERTELAANCTEGKREQRTCLLCGAVEINQTASALGHSYGAYAFDNNATCTADGTQTRVCVTCGEKDTVTAPDTATGHDYASVVTAPTLTAEGYTTYTCTRCGDSYKDDYTDKKQHKYEAVVTEPTCTAQGFTTYTCSECGDSYVDDYTDVVDHTPVIDPAVKPTCSEKGKTEGSHCGVCGYVIKKQALISTNDNHTMEESIVKMPTYDEPGQLAYICTGCGKTDYVEIPPLNKPLVNPFTDVTESDWFFEPVLWAVQEGVTGGKTETTFAPNEGCTRAQVVTFLWAANGKPEPTSENPFTDVANDAWYLKPVLWAVENGITTGVTATEFGPDRTCTRAQIATFLWAANGKPAVSASSEFVDVGDADWYSTPIIWAKENDVTGGIGDGKFGPNDTCTRAQVVTFLKKVYSN